MFYVKPRTEDAPWDKLWAGCEAMLNAPSSQMSCEASNYSNFNNSSNKCIVTSSDTLVTNCKLNPYNKPKCFISAVEPSEDFLNT